MAFKIIDKTNTIAPNATYPYGDIRDNDGTNNGTPVNRVAYSDYHQFFAHIMNLTAVVYNSLPDNAANGFQLVEAMAAFIRLQFGTTGQRGVVQLATNIEVDAGADFEKVVTAGDMALTPTLLHNITAGVRLATKVIDIGDWDMEASDTGSLTKVVAHGLADFTKIRSVSVVIRNDANTSLYDIDKIDSSDFEKQGGVESITATNVNLRIKGAGYFDSNSFDSTSYNRGWITILYQTN